MQLEIGDVIYQMYRGVPKTCFIIDRVTNTQAACGGTKFRRHYTSKGVILIVGSKTSYGPYLYELETPELKKAYRRESLVGCLSKVSFRTLTDEKLEKLVQVLLS